MRIRDPIHGTIEVSDAERALVDSRFFQRLRNVRQLGFGELAFPGATHTRHAHSLGSMHVASRLFDAVASRTPPSPKAAARFRAALRAAVLCHDLGHMPLSHASERIAPPRARLRLPAWVDDGGEGQARHEDFTARILLDSSLTPVLQAAYAPLGLTAEQIASLVVGATPPSGNAFVDGGVDWAPLLRSLVSGELDADRMDYLARDSFYTGVNYGRYDVEWLVSNVGAAERAGRVHLALSRAAAFAFEDFLLSRYHMFVSVYLHHTSVAFDHMLRQYYETAQGEFEIPSDPEAFLQCDDVALLWALRHSKNPWAERIVTRRGYKLVAQFTDRDEGYDLQALGAALAAAGVEHFKVESHAALSRTEDDDATALFIADASTGRLVEAARYIPLYQRYSGALRLSRAYVRPDQVASAEPIVAKLTRPAAGGTA